MSTTTTTTTATATANVGNPELPMPNLSAEDVRLLNQSAPPAQLPPRLEALMKPLTRPPSLSDSKWKRYEKIENEKREKELKRELGKMIHSTYMKSFLSPQQAVLMQAVPPTKRVDVLYQSLMHLKTHMATMAAERMKTANQASAEETGLAIVRPDDSQVPMTEPKKITLESVSDYVMPEGYEEDD